MSDSTMRFCMLSYLVMYYYMKLRTCHESERAQTCILIMFLTCVLDSTKKDHAFYVLIADSRVGQKLRGALYARRSGAFLITCPLGSSVFDSLLLVGL